MSLTDHIGGFTAKALCLFHEHLNEPDKVGIEACLRANENMLCSAAADEIERLRRRVDELEATLTVIRGTLDARNVTVTADWTIEHNVPGNAPT